MNCNELFIDANDLPKALDTKECYKYFEQYKEEGKKEARDKIIMHNIRLVLHRVCNKFGNTSYDQKELVSIGVIGLIKSVDTFEPSKKVEFSTYATTCIDNEIATFMRKGNKYLYDESIDTPIITNEDGNQKTLKDILEDQDSECFLDCEKTQLINAIKEYLETLSERDKEIILLHFEQECAQKDIASQFNLSRSLISKIIRGHIEKLGNELLDKELIENTKKQKKCKATPINIYQYFDQATKEQIDIMLSALTEEERQIVELRCKKDIKNTTESISWTKEQEKKFYGCLLPKMRKLLNFSQKLIPSESSIQEQIDKIPQQIINPSCIIITTENNFASTIKNTKTLSKKKY